MAYASGASTEYVRVYPCIALANGSSRATSAASTCETWSKLAGTCTASSPPGTSILVNRANNCGWSGSQCRAALEKTTSKGASGSQSPISPCTNVNPGISRTPCALQHGFGRVNADGRRRIELAVERRGELTGAATEVDHATRRPSRDERRQIVERLLTLAAKALVLGRVPGVAFGHATPIGNEIRVRIGGQDSVAPVLPRVWTRLALMAAVCAATGCSPSPAAPTALPTDEPTIGTLALPAPPPLTLPAVPALRFQSCAGASGLECSTMKVPLDYADPPGSAISIAVARLPALNAPARGSIVVNPGGPGEPGIDFLNEAASEFTQPARVVQHRVVRSARDWKERAGALPRGC